MPMKTIRCPYCSDVSTHFPILRDVMDEGGANVYCTVGEAPSVVCRAKRDSEILLPIMKDAALSGSDYLLPDAHFRYVGRRKRNPFLRLME